MRTLLVIGIGTGNPEHMTMQAIGALNRADIVLVPRKGEEKAELAELRLEICRRYLTDPGTRLIEFDLPARDGSMPYREAVDKWHQAIADTYRTLLERHTAGDGKAAFLVWGDPAFYDSTLRILERLRNDPPCRIEVIPGISSIQALAASHAIPLNEVAGSVHITTGRRLAEHGFPDDAESVLVMLDGGLSFGKLELDRFEIWWGAYLGSKDEITISGPLAEVAGKIRATRAEARERHGWIMDTYLLRKRSGNLSS